MRRRSGMHARTGRSEASASISGRTPSVASYDMGHAATFFWRGRGSGALWGCLLTLWVLGCAGRIPLPAHLTDTTVQSLSERMQQAAAHVESYRAEARITYVESATRFRTAAIVLVQRPDRIRYDIEGPHGGVTAAFAMADGELQLADFRSRRFLYGPATPRNIDALLSLVPLGLPPSGWVALLLGGLAAPPTAVLQYDDRAGHFLLRWSESAAGWQRCLEVDPLTARVVAASTTSAGGALVSEVRVSEYDGHGLPRVVSMTAKASNKRVVVHLHDVSIDESPDAAVFHLDPAPGLDLEYVGLGPDR